MEHWILIIIGFLAIVFLSNIIQGITGFAGSIIAMPFIVLLVGLDTAKQVLNLLTILSSVCIVIKTYPHIVWNEFFRIIINMIIGVVAGLFLYNIIPLNWLLYILPFFIITIGFRGLYLQKKGRSSNKDLSKTKYIIILLLAGMVHGLFVIGGPLLVIYATQKIKNKAEFRVTLSMVWIVLNSIIAIESFWKGDFTSHSYQYMLLSILPLFLGILVGSKLYKKMSQELFMKISYLLLIVSGVSLFL